MKGRKKEILSHLVAEEANNWYDYIFNVHVHVHRQDTHKDRHANVRGDGYVSSIDPERVSSFILRMMFAERTITFFIHYSRW